MIKFALQKFTDKDTEFFKSLDWKAEAKKIPVLGSYISTVSLIKYVLLNNGYRLTFDNIELAKFSFQTYCATHREKVSLERTSDIFLDRQDRKFMPINSEGSWVSHLTFRE